MTARLIETKTRWIAEDGREDASPLDLFPSVSVETAHFVLHTLGWIQVTYFGRTFEILIDPRSARKTAVHTLVDWLWRMEKDADTNPWLISISCFTGRDWIRQTDSRPHSLIDFLDRMLDFGLAPQVPNTLKIEQQSIEDVMSFGLEEVSAIIDRWRMSKNGLSVEDPFVQALLASPKPGCSVKLLSLNSGDRIVFGAYTPSLTTLWRPDVAGGFLGAPVSEAVPDRSLGSAVENSAREIMRRGEPSVEIWNGPVLSSKGIVLDLEWDRLTVPINSRAKNDAVLVITHRRSPI